ncbi:MAG: polyphosphate polymerase domain-containing protein [Oscillospiraceae bacterium]|jgi:hypothetical protein|nr:polyphosphate polymerase domain-containing protein [Oscillospiraceae bacterium]
MEVSRIPIRHEYKYHVTRGELAYLRRALGAVLRPDPHGDERNEYHIRSLYFDTVDDDALHDKIAGTPDRRKYRIRIYNHSDGNIRLECKAKMNDLISKQSVSIPRDLCEQLMACDPTGLEYMRHPLLREMYREMKLRLLHPVVIVDYVREAYLHEAEEVRITFDKQLRTGLNSVDLFNPHIPTYSPFDDPWEVLEVKYNQFLPSYIQGLLSSVTAVRSAVSKYVWCRRFENKEF